MKDIQFLKNLTDLPAISGDEGLVRELLKQEISKVAEPKIDGFGNIYASIGNGKKVLAVGHMDEIGFMVRQITNDGYLKLSNVGFVFPHGITSQIYSVCTENKIIDGVIALNPEQGNPSKDSYPSVESLLLDIGCKSKDEVIKLGVEIGNSVVAKSNFTILNNNEIIAKAWDNRIGCAISVRLLKELNNLNVKFIGGATTQEEVGLRGARALALNVKPDIAFSLDTSPASNEDGSKIGGGVQIFVMDSYTIGNKKLLKFVKNIAAKNNIKYQICHLRRGGTDAAEFQNITGGIPTLAIGVAVKYIHTPTSVINYDDYENAVKLMKCVIEELNDDIINDIKTF